MELTGTILWWDVRDRNGIIKISDGRKCYFDLSVVDSKSKPKLSAGSSVKFEINNKIIGSLCAKAVKVVASKDKKGGSLRKPSAHSLAEA